MEKTYYKKLDETKKFIKYIGIGSGELLISERAFYTIFNLIKNQPVCNELGYTYKLLDKDLSWVKVEMTEKEKKEQLEVLNTIDNQLEN